MGHSPAFLTKPDAAVGTQTGGTTLSRWTRNGFRRDSRSTDQPIAADSHALVRRRFHASMPNYAETPLRELPDVAREFGIGRAVVKDESSRLGLPAFKMLGASWATFRVLTERFGEPELPTLDGLREHVADREAVTLVTATDGNHGRAVARMAAYLRIDATVLVPAGVPEAATQAISEEGADVQVVAGSYDQTVEEAARLCNESGPATVRLLIQDTSWPGYERVPRWIVDGYATLFEEATDQLDGAAALVVVPAGVGSLAHAAILHCLRNPGWRAVTVEPEVAACVAASLAKGQRVTTVPGSTTMAGLNCGTPSSLAFPDLLATLEGGVWVTDNEAASASVRFAELGIDSGPCGAASLAALRHLATDAAELLLAESTVLLLNTEAAR